MYMIDNGNALRKIDISFNELYTLESIIKSIKELCQDKECSSSYYNLESNAKMYLSEERNNYINLLSLALDKVNLIKKINDSLEKELQ